MHYAFEHGICALCGEVMPYDIAWDDYAHTLKSQCAIARPERRTRVLALQLGRVERQGGVLGRDTLLGRLKWLLRGK
jgi:hypothetical protein